MRGSFLPRSYRSIPQPRGVFSTVLLKSVAVCFYAVPTLTAQTPSWNSAFARRTDGQTGEGGGMEPQTSLT